MLSVGIFPEGKTHTSHFPGTALLAGLGHGLWFICPDDLC